MILVKATLIVEFAIAGDPDDAALRQIAQQVANIHQSAGPTTTQVIALWADDRPIQRVVRGAIKRGNQ